ncbi:MAG: hypothetical protein K6B40_01980 [Firmicutes bacterium]|nr:hypothetical protein [Bacillota bacterium]
MTDGLLITYQARIMAVAIAEGLAVALAYDLYRGLFLRNRRKIHWQYDAVFAAVVFAGSAAAWFAFTDGSLRVLDAVWFGLGAASYRSWFRPRLSAWKKRFWPRPPSAAASSAIPAVAPAAGREQARRGREKGALLSLKQKSEAWTAGVFLIVLRCRRRTRRCFGNGWRRRLAKWRSGGGEGSSGREDGNGE